MLLVPNGREFGKALESVSRGYLSSIHFIFLFFLSLFVFMAIILTLFFFFLQQRKGEKNHVPGIAYNMFKSQYEEPAASEGFNEIKK